VPLVLLWVFAFMRWPRDEAPLAALGGPLGGQAPGAAPRPSTPGAPTPGAPTALPAPAIALPDRRGWQLTGKLANGSPIALAVDASSAAWLLTGAPPAQPTDLCVPDPSVGQPHARLMIAGNRLGLADLGSPGGTLIDGARLLPEHGPRDITAIRTIRLGSVDLSLSKA